MAKKKRVRPGAFKCGRCDRKFSMKAHLVRHMTTIHASARAKAVMGRKKAKLGRPRSVGRPSNLATKAGLRNLTLEQLSDLIGEARAEAQLRIAEYSRAFT